MTDILHNIILPAWRRGRKTKNTPKGWISGNCPCCHLHGQSPDKRSRGGMLPTPTGFSYSCFNCGHTASFTVGRMLSYRARQLLLALGLDQSDLAFINLESLRQRDVADLILSQTERPRPTMPAFSVIDPPGGEILDTANPDHRQYVDYLQNRKINPSGYPFVVNTHRRPGITIPFTHNGIVVGYTTRFLDKKKPKYDSVQQPGYVFGVDLQRPEWSFALLMEGPFCALSLNGLAVMHQVASPEQTIVINSLEKDIIVVPDQNSSGMELIEQALENGWSVSMPPWAARITDSNEAVQQYGKLATLLSIIQHKESNPLKIQLRRKWLAKRLQT